MYSLTSQHCISIYIIHPVMHTKRLALDNALRFLSGKGCCAKLLELHMLHCLFMFWLPLLLVISLLYVGATRKILIITQHSNTKLHNIHFYYFCDGPISKALMSW